MQAIQAYYQKLYDLQDKKAADCKGIMAYFEKGIPGELNFDFETAARQFRLIEDNTLSLIIPYNNEAEALLKKARFSKYPLSPRKFQIYTVNIYEKEFQALQNKGVIDFYGETYAVLNNMSYYSTETGLLIPEDAGGEAIFFDG